MSLADLHLHTIFSDSTYTPEELIRQVSRQDLSAIAVVDHDTVSGIEPTLKIAREKNIELLPGIELSAEHAGLEVHILGYLIDYRKEELLERLDFLRENRIRRVHKIVAKLNELGVKLDARSVFDLVAEGTVGRLHIARALVKEGLVGSLFEVFAKYIGDKCPAYVLGFRFSVKEAVELIRASGGIPVLAHPYILHNDQLILEFINYGMMGIEVYYPEHSQSMTNHYLVLAKKHQLLVTGGSDCHGSAKPEIKIGSIKIPYELVEKLKEAKR